MSRSLEFESKLSMNNVWAISNIVIKELYRRKDFYVLFVLTVVITVLMGAINFFNDDQIARYLKEICLLLIWISSLVIAITTTARQIPAERENRTIYPLMAKPVSRSELILGKFLGSWLACGLALICFYFFFGCVASSREGHWPGMSYFQAAGLHWLALGVVAALTMLGSLVFAAPSSNSTITFVGILGILLVGRHLNKVALQLTEPIRSLVYGFYFAIPHLEFFDVRDLVIHNYPPIPWKIWWGAVFYGFAYGAIFLVAACWVFRRKPLN